MIKTFRHKGLQKFFESGSKAGIQPKHEKRLRLQLSALNVTERAEHERAEQMNVPGFDWHPLTGKMAEHWSISVNGNWRVTFTFEGADAVLVDYQDYH